MLTARKRSENGVMSQLGQNSSDRVPFLPSQTFLAGITELLPTQLTTLCAASLTNASLPQSWSRPDRKGSKRHFRARGAGIRSPSKAVLTELLIFPRARFWHLVGRGRGARSRVRAGSGVLRVPGALQRPGGSANPVESRPHRRNRGGFFCFLFF